MPAARGDLVLVEYWGKLEDGTQFDATGARRSDGVPHRRRNHHPGVRQRRRGHGGRREREVTVRPVRGLRTVPNDLVRQMTITISRPPGLGVQVELVSPDGGSDEGDRDRDRRREHHPRPQPSARRADARLRHQAGRDPREGSVLSRSPQTTPSRSRECPASSSTALHRFEHRGRAAGHQEPSVPRVDVPADEFGGDEASLALPPGPGPP